MWFDGIFYLLYAQYGGSGLNVNYGDIQEMDIPEIQKFISRLSDMRDKEAAELSKVRK